MQSLRLYDELTAARTRYLRVDELCRLATGKGALPSPEADAALPLKEKKGLELMTHEDLVAMIPVDHVMAVKKRWGKMPFDPLLRRLAELTCSRVMRIDDPFPKTRPDGMSQSRWKAFSKDFEETDLYMQYTIRGES